MRFKEFFPIFRDSILGLVFLHMNKIAHRNISPASILRVGPNRYVLADFGDSAFLGYLAQSQENSDFYFFQKNNWAAVGTLGYMAPSLKRQILWC